MSDFERETGADGSGARSATPPAADPRPDRSGAVGDRVSAILSAAEDAAEGIRAEAKRAADQLLKDARRSADEKIAELARDAEARAKSVLASAEERAKEIEDRARRRQEDLRAETQRLEERRRQALDGVRELMAILEDLFDEAREEPGGADLDEALSDRRLLERRKA